MAKIEMGEFMVLSSFEDKTTNGRRYFKLRLKEPHRIIFNEPLGDGGGKSIIFGSVFDAKLWEDGVKLVEALEIPLPAMGQIWEKVSFERDSWRGQPQLIIKKYFVKENPVFEDKLSYMDPPAIDVDKVFEFLFDWSWPIDLKAMMEDLKKELVEIGLVEKLKNVPAGAVNHHNRRGGLLQHMKEMVDLAYHLCRVSSVVESENEYAKRSYVVNGVIGFAADMVDFAILRAAIVLHDLGKIHEYNAETLQWDSDFEGKCLGHSSWGALAVERHWPKGNLGYSENEGKERKLRLQHALLAHHGRDIAVIAPGVPEATLLCSVDILSAHLDVFREAKKLQSEGKLISFNKTLGTTPILGE